MLPVHDNHLANPGDIVKELSKNPRCEKPRIPETLIMVISVRKYINSRCCFPSYVLPVYMLTHRLTEFKP